MKRGVFTFVFLSLIIISSVVNANIILTVNDKDPGVQPFDLKVGDKILIGLADDVKVKKAKLELSIVVTGGTLQECSTTTKRRIKTSETITTTFDADGEYLFSFSGDTDDKLAILDLFSDTDTTIDGKEISAGTRLYELILCKSPDSDQIIVFGVDYESLIYTPDLQDSSSVKSFSEPLESLDFGGEIMMMGMGYLEEDPIWFDNPSQCPDLDNDNFVGFKDFSVFAANWMETGSELAGDFNEDQSVDINDLSQMCQYWLMSVDCPEYYADTLPYMTSFEPFQGFEPGQSLDYQMGWQVQSGQAMVYPHESDYRYVFMAPGTTIIKEFNDGGDYNTYIRCEMVGDEGDEINIISDLHVIAGIRFGTNGYIQVLDNGSYVPTSQPWYSYAWCKVTFVMDYYNNRYDVIWTDFYYQTDGTIKYNADFGDDYDQIDSLEFSNNYADHFVLDRLSISDQSTGGGQFGTGNDIYITTPCACAEDQSLQGRVPITGSVWYEGLGWYKIYICPSDLDEEDEDNWQLITSGYNVVIDDLLGYWDTSRIPNGYYYLIMQVSDDFGYVNSAMVTKEVEINGQMVYNGPGYFPVVGDLKSNTFYYEEKPDISVSWAGQFPFEFRRIYNNNRKFYSKPIRNGWTNNNHIKLIEDTRYNWETRSNGLLLVPAWDDDLLGFGYIWIQYPDGSRRLFRNDDPEYAGSTVTYRPYPDDNTGDYIERQSYYDFVYSEFDVYYTLCQRDGTEMSFYSTGNTVYPYSAYGGCVGWKVEVGISSMTDRFGNSLSFGWNYNKTAVTSITDGRATISLDLDVNGEYYTEARLEVDQNVYRTVEFDYTDQTNPIFTVTKTGKGVNEQGVYGAVYDKEYTRKYQYDSGKNLRQIININNSAQDETLIEVDYDNYGRVQTRKDYIEQDNYLETTYYYNFDDTPGGSNMTTVQSTESRGVITVQNKDGALISQNIVTSDGSSVTNTSREYDSSNPLKPTDVNEYFDGFDRFTKNDYSYYGDLEEQKVYVDDVNYIATKIEYHPDYSLETKRTSWQDTNKSGPLVQKLSVYGLANGTENINGDYLVKEKVLISQDPNVWAVTSYEYYDTGFKKGLVKKITDPENFVTIIDYDNNGYLKIVRKGTTVSTEPVQRFYNDSIGQRLLEANSLGGVTRYYYDGFGRLYLTRKYEDTGVMSLTDVQFVPGRYDQMTAVAESKSGYDEQGFKTFEKLETGGEVDTSYTYNGLAKRKTFDDQSYVEFGYDSRGNKIQHYFYEYTGQEDWYVTFDYDSMDRQIGANWFDYNDITVIKSQMSEYYGSGQKQYDRFYGDNGLIEKEVSYNYDILSRLTSTITDPEVFALTTTYNYDAAGNQTSVIDPKGSIIYADYDNANRRTAEYFAASDGTEHNQATVRKVIEYYDNNKVLSETNYDYDGSTILSYNEFVYDGRERLKQVTQQIDQSNDAITVYDYSDSGFGSGNAYHIRITDAESKYTWIALDKFGRRTKTLYPSTDYELNQYNGDGSLYRKAVWNAGGIQQWITYGYDGYGRLLTTTYPDSGTVTNTYDGFGRKILIEDDRNANDNIGGAEEIIYVYDTLNRVASYTDQDGYIVSYSYRHDNQKQGITVEQPGTPTTKVYDIRYSFDSANRLEYVHDGLITDPMGGYIANLAYDDNGNRSSLSYYLAGSLMGSVANLGYSYNLDNYLTNFSTSGGPTFSFDADDSGDIGGLGRLASADETIGATSRTLSYTYDDLSQLKTASITNINSTTWAGSYTWHEDGNLDIRTEAGTQTNHSYTGDLLTTVGVNNLTWDDNGSMTAGVGVDITRNADNRIQSATVGSDSIDCIYDPEGRMIFKTSTINQSSSTEKYILDVVGDYPMILLVINPDTPFIDQRYFHANGQTLMQQAGENKYFYIHDRIGSIRQIINSSASVVNSYTYDPWGNAFGSETSESIYNHYQFANYHWDSTVGMYYLNARWYDPAILRFTGRDPVRGEFQEPLTLHPYLYCMNNTINATDPSGEFLGFIGGQGIGANMRRMSLAIGSRAMGFAGRIYTAAFYRAVQINMFIHGISTGSKHLSRIPITGYTRHGINSAISRDGVGVSPQAILNAVSNPSQVIPQSNGTFKYIGENAVVILNEFGQVVTTWATSSNAWR